jgi:hypothetical protein
VLLVIMMIVFPVYAYWVVSQYWMGKRTGFWWFQRNHTFPDKPNANETQQMATRHEA